MKLLLAEHLLTRAWQVLLAGVCLLLLVGVARAQSEARPAGEVQETVQDVLRDAEFRHLFERMEVEKPPEESAFSKWLRDFLRGLFPNRPTTRSNFNVDWDLSAVMYSIMIVLLVILVAVLLVAIWKWMPATRVDTAVRPTAADQEAIAPTSPPGDLPTNEYERRALEAAAGGDYRGAIRELVLGSMSWVERAGFIRYRRGLTNRDYIRAVWRFTERRNSLLTISGAFERVFYGRRTADEEMFTGCLKEFRTSFAREQEHATLAS